MDMIGIALNAMGQGRWFYALSVFAVSTLIVLLKIPVGKNSPVLFVRSVHTFWHT